MTNDDYTVDNYIDSLGGNFVITQGSPFYLRITLKFGWEMSTVNILKREIEKILINFNKGIRANELQKCWIKPDIGTLLIPAINC